MNIDLDVIYIAISLFLVLELTKLWVTFGIRKHFQYLPIHQIVTQFTPKKGYVLPLFHALTGSDNTSYFAGVAKKRFGRATQR